jgi:hypothetical protein
MAASHASPAKLRLSTGPEPLSKAQRLIAEIEDAAKADDAAKLIQALASLEARMRSPVEAIRKAAQRDWDDLIREAQP